MIKVAYISTYPPTHCGVAEYTRMLAVSLASILHDLKIYVLSNDETYNYEGNKIHIYPSFRRKSNNYSKILDVLSKLNGVDILHIQHEYGIYGDNNGILDAAMEAKREKLVKRIIFTMHSVYHPLSNRFKALEFQRMLNYSDAVIVHSYLQEFELQHQGVNPLIIHRIPHGTLLNPFLGVERTQLTSEFQIDSKNISNLIMVLPGFIRRDKGIDILMEAVKNLKSKLDFSLIIAGEIRDKELFQLILESTSKLNTILIDKYLSHEALLKLMALSDIILLPYRDKIGIYSVSGILHLSIGSMRPLVGSRTPRLIELYQFAPRLTVPPKNPLELSKKIKWVIENYEYAVAYMATLYGYAARTQWIRMARRHLYLYKQLLE